MAASELTVAAVVKGGVSYAEAAANADGNYFTNTGAEIVLVKNGGGSPITVTVVTQNTSDGLAVADRTVSVAAGGSIALGCWPRTIYNDANARVQLTYSGVTSVTVKVLSVTAELI